MKNKLFSILFFLITSLIYSQNFNIGDTIFYKKRVLTDKQNADYYAVIDQKKIIKGKVINLVSGYKYVKDSAKFLLKSKYSLKEFETHRPEGIQTNFHQNGKKSSEGLLLKTKPIGKWTYWYKNGTIREERLYYENKLSTKKYKSYDIINFWNRKGEQTVKKGDGFFSYQKDSTLRKGYYKEGKKTGKWTGFNNDRKYFEETYKKGKLTSGISWDKEGKEYNYKKHRINPKYEDGIQGIKKHILKYYRIPESAKRDKIDGRMIVTFKIMKDGSIDKIRVLKSLSDDYDKEAIRIVKSMKKWTPGKIRGQKVNVSYTLPITYNLE